MANMPKGAVRPSLQLDGTAMYMNHDGYIARAVRGSDDAAFAAPTRVPEFVGLVFAGVAIADNGLRLYLHGDANNGEDRIAVASRASLRAAWQTPVLLSVGTAPHHEIYPAISGDELRLYWTDYEAGLKVKWASRTSVAAPFVAQTEIPGLNVGQVWMPTESHSGLELFFTRNDDVWRMTRATLADAWGSPERVDELSSTAIDYVGTLSADDSTMYFNYQNSAQPAEFTLWLSKRWCERL